MGWLRLGVRGRIYSGFGGLLAPVMALGGIALWTLFSINHEVTVMDATSDHTIALREVSRDVEVLRNSIQHTAFGSEQSAIDMKAAQNALQQLRTAAEGTRSDERRRIYQALARQIGVFEEERAKWAGLSSQLQVEMTKLFADGDQLAASSERLFAAARGGIEQSITALASDVKAAVLLVRVANWRFLATQDVRGPGTFKSNLVNARAAIAKFEAASLPNETRTLIAPVKA